MTAKIQSGRNEGSFAYITIKDRLPVIITNVIDHLCQEKVNIAKRYREGSSAELKEIISKLSQLKSEMQTNKPLTYFNDSKDGCLQLWNSEIANFKEVEGEFPRWFTATWLFVECYFYKRIHETFKSSELLSNFDPYEHLKCKAFEESTNDVLSLLQYMDNYIGNLPVKAAENEKSIMGKLLKFSLWGNQHDLSISSGVVLSEDERNSTINKDDHILINDFELLWNYVSGQRLKNLAIVLDNAGFELVTDLCLASTFYELGLFKSITFYVKDIPWFVSDTTKKDLHWTLDRLCEDKFGDYGKKIKNYFDCGAWKFEMDPFWTLPYGFCGMRNAAPALYNDLSQYSLIIFKGDLNYRKLINDLIWPEGTTLSLALDGFIPCPLLAIRTIKGGPVVNLNVKSNLVKQAFLKKDWFRSGEFGVIQFVVSGHSSEVNLS